MNLRREALYVMFLVGTAVAADVRHSSRTGLYALGRHARLSDLSISLLYTGRTSLVENANIVRERVY